MEYWNGITYNHCEKISIPSNLFESNKGKLVIKIISFSKKNQDEKYMVRVTQEFEFNYELTDKDTVKIDFK